MISSLNNSSFWNTTSYKVRLLIGIPLILVSLLLNGCNLPISAQPTPQGNIIVKTLTPTSATAGMLSQLDSSSPTSQPDVNFVTPQLQVDFNNFRHLDGLFELEYPSNWSLIEGDNLIEFKSPDQDTNIQVQVANTGYPLDEAAIKRYVEARENNKFSTFNSYLETTKQFFPDNGSWLVEKQISFDDKPTVVLSFYYPSGNIVLITDIWSSQETFEENYKVFKSFLDSISITDDEAPRLLFPIATEYFQYDNEHVSMEIPLNWDYQHTQGENTSVDTFLSPDEHALVQVIVYDDGKSISRSVAGDFVLFLLRNHYTKDISVTSDVWLADRRERLTWYSPSGKYGGTTYFETQGTAMIVYTEMIEDGHRQYYEDQIEYIVESYNVKH